MPAEPKNIPLNGLFPVPQGLADTSTAHRAKFWKLIGQEALRLKRGEILSGIDIWGRKFQPIKRRWGVRVPLIPHSETSRTYDLLSLNSTARGATLFWRSGDGRVPWPKILSYHAYRHGPRNLPVRNTIGLSPRSVEAIMEKSEEWQAGYEAGLEAARKSVVATPAPGPRRETRLERILRQKAESEALRPKLSPVKGKATRGKSAVAEFYARREREAEAAAKETSDQTFRNKLAAYTKGDETLAAIAEISRESIDAGDTKNAIARRVEDLMARTKATKDRAEKKALKKEMDAAVAELQRADLHAFKMNWEARRKVLSLIEIKDKSSRLRIEPTIDSSFDEPRKRLVDGGIAFLNRILAKKKQDKIDVAFRPVAEGQQQRSGYNEQNGIIDLEKFLDVGTVVHEFGHRLEHTDPEWKAAALEFLRYRVGNEKSQSLRKVLGKEYEDYEEGRKDRFEAVFGPRHSWYVGKDYGDGGTEVTSMAIQKLFDDPVRFAANDPEMFKWLLGMLDGGLR